MFPNCSARAVGERQQLLGPALGERASISGLSVRRPVERGYLVNTDLQSDIWSAALRTLLHKKATDCGLLLTEPLLNLPNIRDSTDQVGAAVSQKPGRTPQIIEVQKSRIYRCQTAQEIN